MSETINYFYIENAYSGSNTVTVTRVGDYQSGKMVSSLQYSKDLENWSTINISTTETTDLTLNENEKVYFRNDNGKFSYAGRQYIRFNASNSCMSGGNIMSLLNYNDMLNTQLSQYCFYNMFYGCTSLTTAPELPATTLAEHCYGFMFSGCTSLTTAPELPATTLAGGCYYSMFYGCTSLTTAPELPATTLVYHCYNSMFYGCTSLTTAPELPATTLDYDCYLGMFSGCTSLTTAPELPAATLANSCYSQMFSGCTSLTTAPELPATTLANTCYQGMFSGCTSLTTAPELPATTLDSGCYQGMFSGCTSLTTAPELPATTLAEYCYSQMFSICYSLTTAPELPATTLAEYCYFQMFKNCTSLNEVTIYANDISAENCLNSWLENVSATGTFHKNGFANYTRNSSGIPSGWTVVTPYTYNNIIKFDYSIYPSELLNNIWVQTYTDITQNTIVGVGEHTEEVTVTHYWRTITFDFTGKSPYTGVFSIEVSVDGVPVEPYNFESLSGDIVKNVSYDNDTLLFEGAGAGMLTNFSTAIENTVYTEKEIAGTWSYTASTTTSTETVTTYDHYEVTLYINSALNTFETTMFADDDNITSIEFDYDVTSIIDDAFNGCENLSSVTLTSTVPPTIGEDTFSLISPDAVLYVPTASIPAYQNAGFGDYFAEIRGMTPVPPKRSGFNVSGMIDTDFIIEVYKRR